MHTFLLQENKAMEKQRRTLRWLLRMDPAQHDTFVTGPENEPDQGRGQSL